MKTGIPIGELAVQLQLNPKTIRYYEEVGLLPEPRRSESGYRLYSTYEMERLRLIKKAKVLGLSLAEIKEIVEYAVNGRCGVTEARLLSLIETKLGEINQKIEDLISFRNNLRQYHQKLSQKLDSEARDEHAGVPFCGTTALYFLKKMGKLQDGQKVLSNGASGGVGTFSVQTAKYYGAEVTGVCSTANLEMVQSLGADKVIDYTKEDFTKTGQTYDIIFDTVGKRTYSQCRNSLNQKGIYLNTIATVPLLLQMLWTSKIGSKKAKFGLPPCAKKELDILKDIIEAGKLKMVIDRTYPLSEIAEAHRYSESGHAKGKLVITL